MVWKVFCPLSFPDDFQVLGCSFSGGVIPDLPVAYYGGVVAWHSKLLYTRLVESASETSTWLKKKLVFFNVPSTFPFFQRTIELYINMWTTPNFQDEKCDVIQAHQILPVWIATVRWGDHRAKRRFGRWNHYSIWTIPYMHTCLVYTCTYRLIQSECIYKYMSYGPKTVIIQSPSNWVHPTGAANLAVFSSQMPDAGEVPCGKPKNRINSWQLAGRRCILICIYIIYKFIMYIGCSPFSTIPVIFTSSMFYLSVGR